MTTTCPHCGNAVRPGARFCGSCGETLEADQVTTTYHDRKATCPHCGMPVRTDARFCPSCGEAITTIAVSATAEDESVEPAQTPAETPPVVGTPPPGTPPSEPTAGTPAPRRNWLLIITLVIMFVIVLALGGYVVWEKGWFGLGGTQTPTTSVTSIALLTPSPTEEAAETGTPTLTPEGTPQATETLLPTPTTQATTVIEEDFETDLGQNWIVWGTPEPQVVQGLTNFLDLDAAPRAAGVTSKALFALSPNMQISFEAALKDSTPDDILSMDWDPVEVIRQPGEAPAPLHLDLGEDGFTLVVSGITVCREPIPDNNNHTYTIQLDINLISLQVDGDQVCPPVTIDIPLGEGRIAFAGRGRIDNILVAQ